MFKRCQARCKDGKQCSFKSKYHLDDYMTCGIHRQPTACLQPRPQCEVTTKAGNRCKMTAKEMCQQTKCCTRHAFHNEDCSICFEVILKRSTSASQVAEVLHPCKHVFHEHCLSNWTAQMKQTCPMCRAVIHTHREVQYNEILHRMTEAALVYICRQALILQHRVLPSGSVHLYRAHLWCLLNLPDMVQRLAIARVYLQDIHDISMRVTDAFSLADELGVSAEFFDSLRNNPLL